MAHAPPPLPAYLAVPDGAVPLRVAAIATPDRFRPGAVRAGPFTLVRGDPEWTRLWSAGAPGASPPPVDFRAFSVIALRVGDGNPRDDVAPEVYAFGGTTYVVLEEGRYLLHEGPDTRIELFRIPVSHGSVGRVGFRPAAAPR